jgi:hypothetical protein
MDHEHRHPATTWRSALSVSHSPAGTPSTEAGPVPAEFEEDLWLEREREYAELGGEG